LPLRPAPPRRNSLWREKLDKSPMAAQWMIEHGLLSGREFEAALKAVARAAK